MAERKFDLGERLINFAVSIIHVAEKLPKTFSGNHLASQIVRSGTSPALNYGEALSAESRNDFIHKMKIAAKELRETYNCLMIINRMKWEIKAEIPVLIQENYELIAIFVKSIDTARQNSNPKKA